MKKLILLFLLCALAACSSSKPVARSGGYKKSPTAVRTKKPAGRTSTAARPVSAERKKIEQEYQSAKEEGKSTSNQSVYSKTEILEATTRVKVTTAMVLEYIDLYKDVAKGNMKQYGIPASIILGQAILESGAGTGPLSAIANNHFGIKCHKEWTGPSVKYDDDAAQECFRQYEHPGESFRDHSLFLTSRPRYAELFTYEKDDYQAWARGLKAAGYATDKKYPEKLIGIIERYQLQQYDAEVTGKEFVPINSKATVSTDSNLYQVSPGDTLYSISKRFNISVDDLRKKNNITDNTISIGQTLRIN